MGKFSNVKTIKPRSVIKATTPSRTFEGGKGYNRDAKSDLFLLAVVNMVGEKTFYESADVRDGRFVSLVHAVTQEDPAWVARFVPYLRDSMNMRSASIVTAAEYVAAGGPNGRQVVAAAISRADEPAEMLAYWISNYGKNIPKPIKRGVADAVNSVYNQYSALKYDGVNNTWRMGDVIELVHPKVDGWKNDLYKYLLDVRHHPESVSVPKTLSTIEQNKILWGIPVAERKGHLSNPDALKSAGMTWESLSGWLQGPMDAQAWEAIIPSMGYMALIRNLRNFDQAGISDDMVDYVINKITDPEEVAKSRQFPYRFYSAYKNTPSENWKRPLDKALNLACENIPVLSGRTLVLVDISGSMTQRVSGKSTIQLWETGAVFAGALYKKNQNVDVVVFGDNSMKLDIPKGASAMRVINEVAKAVKNNHWYGSGNGIGHGTNGNAAMRFNYNNHDRVVYFTDGQYHDCGANPGTTVYTFNLGGHGVTPFKQGSNGNYELGGFSDSVFSMMKMIEDKRAGKWPF